MQLVCVVFLFSTFLVSVSTHKNNVCKTFKDYYKLEDSENCYYDPAAEYEAPELITEEGYPLETYKVTSSDGYILTLFRLPNFNYPQSNGYSVFLQHGILSNGASFLGLGKDSLPYVLWEAGYDVWIGNYRGTYYSEEHVNLTVHDKEYWDHSIDEMATIDIPLTMKFIAQTTGTIGNIYYIGYSLGTTIGLMYASEFPEEAAEYVKLFVLLAPAYSLRNMVSPYKKILTQFPKFWRITTKWDLYRLFGQSRPLKDAIQYVCLETPVTLQLCNYIQNLFLGITTGVQLDKVPQILNPTTGGTGLKVLAHVSQFIFGKFQKFDYGIGNLRKYGSLQPPAYDIKKTTVPFYVVHGKDDWIVARKDVMNLYNTLPPSVRYGIREISEVSFSHLDFVMGPHARELVYNDIVNVFNSFPHKAPFVHNNKDLLL